MANETVNRYLNIYIQSGEAQKALDVLLAKEKKLTDELSRATDPKKVAALNDQLAKLAEPIDRATKKLKGDLSPSLRDTQAAVNNLGNRMRRMSEEDADFSNVVTQFRQGTKELDEQRGKVGLLQRAMKSFWQEAKTVAVGVIVGNTIQSALQTVLGYVTGIVTGSAKIADELSDIEKTTGLTGDQVRKINAELGKIDTRTSREELRKLASEAGKLGEDTEAGVIKFVDSADKIRVALKEDLGEEAILDIAKTSKIFQEEMLNMASAINEIGASSEASEAFSVDFLKRTGATASTVKIAAGDVLGYSAALEIAGQTTEVSATALNTFFLDFISNLEKFGNAAGFADGELTKLVKEKGTNEGFLQFLERLKAANPDAADFINKLRGLGIDGARGSNVMLSLANNIETVRKQQGIANEAIKSNSSIMDEFNKKNNNAAAELAKLKKDIAGLFQSSSFQQAGENAIKIMRGFVDVIKASFAFIKEHGGLITTLGVIYGVLLLKIKGVTLATIYNNVATRASAIASNIAASAQAFYVAVTMRATAQLTLLRRAQMAWNAVASLGAGPLGILIVGIGALVVGIGNLIGKTRQLTVEQKLQAEIAEKISESTGEQVANIERLAQAAANENLQLGERKKAIDELIKINPAFADTLKINAEGHLEGAAAIATYIAALNKQAEAEAKKELLTDKIRKKNAAFAKLRAEQAELANLSDEQILKALSKQASDEGGSVAFGITTNSQEAVSEIKGLQAEITALNKGIEIAANEAAAAVKNGAAGAGDGVKEVGESIESLRKKLADLQDQRDKTTDDSIRKSLNKQIDDIEKQINELLGKKDKVAEKTKKTVDDLLKDLLKLREEVGLATLSAFDRELAELDIKYAKLRERAGKNTKLLLVIDELYHEEKLILIRDFARREVAEWGKAQGEINKKAEETFKKNIEALKAIDKRVKDEIASSAGTATDSKLATAELAVLQSRGKKRLEAELRLLKEQESHELNAKELTENQKLLIEEKYRQKRKQAEMEYWIGIVNTSIDFLSQLATIDQIFSDAKTQRENAELERDRKINDKKKSNLDRRLKAGTISQQQYDREVAKIERDQEKRQKEIARKQFERDKRQKFINALINNAGAVATTLERFGPPIPPNFLGIAAMALTVATGVAQLVTIAKQKAPEFGRGGKLFGPSHQDKSRGMPVTDPYSGRVHAYMEGGEGVVNKRTMADRNKYTVNGTPSQIISLLNAKHRGVHWETGAKLMPAWKTAKSMPMNYPAIRKYYALGGKFGTGSATAEARDTTENATVVKNDLVAVLMQQNEIMMETISAMQTTIQELTGVLKAGIKAPVVLSDIENAQERIERIREEATLK